MPKKGYEMTLVNKTFDQMVFSYGSLSITTLDIEGASIKINNTLISEKTPCQLSTFPTGTYTITVYKDTYNTISKTIEVFKDKKTEVEFVLKQVSNESLANNIIDLDDIDNEGFWLPMLVERLNYVDMQKMGLQLTPEELYSINNSSLKDAIVGLSNGAKPRGFFCTGEIVSDKGLLFTANHCGFSSIAALSTVEHDYITEGFWARNFRDELPAEGVSASFLVRMENVTDKVLNAVSKNMDYQTRNNAIDSKIKELEAIASEGGKLNPVIKSFFEGNEYYMFVYKTYTDVRLVGTPPRSIGWFGGNTDEWMWPRETCDFCVFRVYANKNSEPASFSWSNKPLTPNKHLTISLNGVNENDFTMMCGYPGSTERYMTSYGVNYNLNSFYPCVYEVFKAETDIMDYYMNTDESANIAYADNRAGLARTWKNFAGQMIMLRKNRVSENKAELESQFTQWTNAKTSRKKEYGYVLDSLKMHYKRLGEIGDNLFYPNFITQVTPLSIAGNFINYYNNPTKETGTELKSINVDELFKDLDFRIEKEMFCALLKIYGQHFEVHDIPTELQKLVKKYRGNWETLAIKTFDNSMFSNPESTKVFIKNPNTQQLSKDPAFIILNALLEQIYSVVPIYRFSNQRISELNHIYMKGLREFYAETEPDKVVYPDANSTMRYTYGYVKDYVSQEGKAYNYYSTSDDLIKKCIPGDKEFGVPNRFLDLLKNRDFGRYSDENGDLRLCFLTKSEITGGYSGAPCLNSRGELVGLGFDGNWEAMGNNLQYEPTLQRAINVDIRYVLFVVDKFAGAQNIIDELDIKQ